MAFIPTLNTQHPKIWPLFKWVALIFLAPLMVLAVIPILITTIAQLPVLGQVNFAFLGGTLASLPVVIRRQRRKPKEQALGGIAACTHIALSFTVIGCLFAWGLTHQLAMSHNVVLSVVLSLLGGFGIFWGTFEIAREVETVLRKLHKHSRASRRSEDHKKIF